MSNDKKNADEGIRIQKFLSLAGIASRRHAEELIAQGRVKVSGRVVTEMGTHVIPGKSRVEVDNKPVFYSEERNYILFHKPAECITTLDDPEHRTTVIDLLPDSLPRVFPVGRLDWDTEGLLLLTNDGDLAYRLTHPAVKIPRVYHVKIRGELKDNSPELKKLQNGIDLEDGLAKPDRVAVIRFTGNNTWLEIELHIGRNRIIRRMMDALGFPVMKLRRVAFGNLTLDGLALGAFRDLTEGEVAELYAMCGDLGSIPTIRSRSGVRFAKGFTPKERTMKRQVAPTLEELERRNAKKKSDSSRKAHKDSRRPEAAGIDGRRNRQPENAPRFAHDTRRSFNASWDMEERNDGKERKSFPRDEDKREKKSFPRDEDRRERKSFPRDEDRREKKSFPRDEDRREKKSFQRDEDRREKKSFQRDEDRRERKSFPRDEDRRERKSFPRDEDRRERKSFPRRDDRNDSRDSRPGPRHEHKSIVRDEHGFEKKRPFAKGVKPKSRPHS